MTGFNDKPTLSFNRVRLEPLKERLRTLVERRFRGEPARCAGCEHANGGSVKG